MLKIQNTRAAGEFLIGIIYSRLTDTQNILNIQRFMSKKLLECIKVGIYNNKL